MVGKENLQLYLFILGDGNKARENEASGRKGSVVGMGLVGV
jgi:hypothetical protein